MLSLTVQMEREGAASLLPVTCKALARHIYRLLNSSVEVPLRKAE